MSDWTIVFMDENNQIFHREPLIPGVPLPISPTASFNHEIRSEVCQYLEIPNWKGKNPVTIYYTIINYERKEFVVAVHGIFGE